MNKTILFFILNAIENNPNNQSLGEEVRALKSTLVQCLTASYDSVLRDIFDLINQTPNDYELGTVVRRLYIPLKLYVDMLKIIEENELLDITQFDKSISQLNVRQYFRTDSNEE